MKCDLTEQGQTTILVVGLALVVFAVTGLAVDGTRAFLFRRTLQNIADSSVLAAAADIDQSRYYASGGRVLQLDPTRADETARQWLNRRGIDLGVSVDANEDGVHVTARGALDSTFLALVGIDRIPVEVNAAARPLPGRVPNP
ncbi:MAG: hypothetical protein QOH48_276 [Actinomycetota bacterium]|nr:hypothetical protein [Actinomycetota bacterium]